MLQTTQPTAETATLKPTVPDDAQLLTMPQLEVLTQLHRTRLYLFIREGTFPAPLKMGRTARWHRPAVEQWIADLVGSTASEGGAV